MMRNEPWLTKKEIAAHLRVSTRAVERLDLPHQKVGGQNRYKISEVEAELGGSPRHDSTAHLENAARALQRILNARDRDKTWVVEVRPKEP
jgi:hypothetical protein